MRIQISALAKSLIAPNDRAHVAHTYDKYVIFDARRGSQSSSNFQ